MYYIRRALILANAQNATFSKDLIWRIDEIAKFEEDLIWPMAQKIDLFFDRMHNKQISNREMGCKYG